MTTFDLGPWKKEKAPDIKPPEYIEDESWDDMVGQGGYDPRAATEDKPILRRLIGATPAQKRRFYEQEQKRLQRLQDIADGKIIPKEEPKEKELSIKEEWYDDDSDTDSGTQISIKTESPETNVEEVHVKEELMDETESTVIKKEPVEEQDIIDIKQEPMEDTGYISEKEVKLEIKEEVKDEPMADEDDEYIMQHRKRQQELVKIIRNLRETHPDDPRLRLPEDGGRRERSLSPIFQEESLAADPRLRINPFAFIKGKEVGDGSDPRLKSLLQRDKNKFKAILLGEDSLKDKSDPEPEKENSSNNETSIEIQDTPEKSDTNNEKPLNQESEQNPLLDDVESLPSPTEAMKSLTVTPIRRTRSASVESRESGEVSEHEDDDEIIEIKSEPEDEKGAVCIIIEDSEIKNGKRRSVEIDPEHRRKISRSGSESKDSSDSRIKHRESKERSSSRERRRKEKKERKKKRRDKKEKRKEHRESSGDEYSEMYGHKSSNIYEYPIPVEYPHGPARSLDYNFYYSDSLYVAHRPIKREPGYEGYYY